MKENFWEGKQKEDSKENSADPALAGRNQQEKNEVSLEEKEIVQRIEKLEVGSEEKTLIMLVWKGLKPAAEFDSARYDAEDDPKRKEQIAETARLFADLNLFSHRTQKVTDCTRYDKNGNGTEGVFYRDGYYLAKDKDDLQYLVDHFGKKEDYEITKKLGKIFGYPATATDAWNADDRSATILERKWQDSDLYARDEMAFVKFRLSKTHGQKEFETVKKWAEEIKRLDLPLYEKTVRNYRKYVEKEAKH